MLHFQNKAAMPPSLRRALEEQTFEWGQSYDSYIVNGPGYEYLWTADRRAVAAFARRGRYVNVVGGLIGPANAKAELLDELLALAQRHGYVISVLNMTDDDLPRLRRRSFQVTKWGEDALVPVAGRTWEGGAFSWLRRQESFVRRAGVTITEGVRSREELLEVAWLGLAGKAQKGAMRVFEGQLDPDDLGRSRIFEAHGKDGRLEGFVMANPCRGGREWALEMYRKRPDAVRGVVPATMLHAMRTMGKEGVERVSLCLVPAYNVRRPMPGDSWLARWSLLAWSRFGGRIFDTQGLHHYKSRFRPELEPRYVAVYPRASLGSMWAFVRLWGVLELGASSTRMNQ